MKRNTDGSESPYELNITYFDAVSDPEATDIDDQVHRFLAGQALMLSLKGIPGIYFHSLVGTPNNHEGVRQTGRARTINRRKFQREELDSILDNPHSPQAQVLAGYRRMLAIRRNQPAFHPDASQQVIQTDIPALVALIRESTNPAQKLLVLANLGPQPASVNVQSLIGTQPQRDLLSRDDVGPSITLAPHHVAWLEL